MLDCEQTEVSPGGGGASGDRAARRRCRSRGQMKWVDSGCIWETEGTEKANVLDAGCKQGRSDR